MAYRWAHTDAALTAQLELEDEGVPGVLEPGHAGSPVHQPDHRRGRPGHDAHRDAPTARRHAATATGRTVGSSVWQVFAAAAPSPLGDQRDRGGHRRPVRRPVLVRGLAIAAHAQLDLFTFSDAPVYEALGLARTSRGEHK